ncbi:MAG: LamG domain-containing protein [Pirellulales bacterium]|nr:LamG domain-containing protein [Pirellulales bacterium]
MWLFDDPSGASVAVDSSGNNYHLSLGPDSGIVTGGKYGNALDPDLMKDQDGVGAHRYKAEAALNPGDADWTLECWLKAHPEMIGDNRIWGLSGINYIEYGQTRNGKEFKNSRLRTGGLDQPNVLQVANRLLPVDEVRGWNRPTGDLKADQQFHHLAVVYDASARQIRHYFDGKKQFEAEGLWEDVFGGGDLVDDVVFPPHYPMLQIGMRDALQHWDHHELHEKNRYMKKFQGLIDEMRFSDQALYAENFIPPGSFAASGLRVWPPVLSLVVDKRNPSSGQLPALEISAIGGDPLPWKLTENIEWLLPATRRGVANGSKQQVAMRVSAADLKSGQYEGRLTVHPASRRKPKHAVTVKLTVIGEGDVCDVSDRKQLFIDDQFTDVAKNIQQEVNQPQKVRLTIDGKQDGGQFPLVTFYDEQRGCYRLYYMRLGSNVYCMESDDGIDWKHVEQRAGQVTLETTDANGKPQVQQPNGEPYDMFHAPPVQGVSGFRTDFPMIVYDPHDVPERRYKAFHELNFGFMDGDGYELSPQTKGKNADDLSGVYGYYSSDGLHFKGDGVRLLPLLPEHLFGAYWDKKAQKYFIYIRCQNVESGRLHSMQGTQFIYRKGFKYSTPEGLVDHIDDQTGQRKGFENLRSVARLTADDLLKPWKEGVYPSAYDGSTAYATARDVKMVVSADKWDGFKDFYSCFPAQYPWAEDVHIMYLKTLRHFHPSRQPWFPGFADLNGPLQTVIALSRDGINWNRYDRKEYVPLGLMDEVDRGRTSMGGGIIKVGNYLYSYYWASPQIHDTVPMRDEYPLEGDLKRWAESSLGIFGTRQRLDGFVSMDADYQGGSLTTPPLVFSGRRLVLNQNAGGQGTIFVELRDLNDQPISGYTLADCEEITCNDVAWEVRWRGKADLSHLAGRPIKLHFKMRAAKLYAFQFKPEAKTDGSTKQ